MEVRCEKTPWRDDIEILVYDNWEDSGGRHTKAGAPLTMVDVVDGDLARPTIRLKNQAAQQLMDELWRCGLRPSEGTGSAGSLAATERHLKDMRTLVFERLLERAAAAPSVAGPIWDGSKP